MFFRCALIFLSLSSFLFAQQGEMMESYCCTEDYICRVYVGAQAANLHLQIRGTTDLQLPGAQQGIKMNGPLGGAFIGFEYKAFHGLYAALLADTLTGRISKDGYPSRQINDVETETRIGYTYQALQGKQFHVTGYIGIGFNYISQDLDLAPSYKYYQYYLPTGLLLDWKPRDWITIEFHFSWRPAPDTTVRVSTLPGARFTLRRKIAQYFIEMPFTFHLGCLKNWDISIVPFWKRKKDGASKLFPAGVPLGLPKQAYTYGGAEFLIGYRF